MTKKWTAEEVLDLARLFQPVCVLAAAADLDVFTPLHEKLMTAQALASELGTDLRATTILLDALVAMELLTKQGDVYSVPDNMAELLTEKSAKSILPMVRHMSNCHRRWAALAGVTQTGKPAERTPSVRGEAADQAAFIGAMHNLSEPIAAEVVGRLQPLKFDHLLDIGGASGTWTMAFLNAIPEVKATLFDFPPVISMAERRLAEAGLNDRVNLVPGDFYADDLPDGADLAWLGAICHQNSREQNQSLFKKIHKALKDEGVVVIRDVVMDPSHTSPKGGALFAVNMLVNTQEGSTYTFDEYSHDLSEAGFGEVTLVHQDEFMNSLIRAKKVKK
ncbi:MAG: methyltransferase domain-containing protein [Planctomycetes bacterium]|nr:methyltransferase domain-containing protein [Planctomycetota bacterium]